MVEAGDFTAPPGSCCGARVPRARAEGCEGFSLSFFLSRPPPPPLSPIGMSVASVPSNWSPNGGERSYPGAERRNGLPPLCLESEAPHARPLARPNQKALTSASTPCTRCSTPGTLCGTPSTPCSTPSSLCSTPSTLCSSHTVFQWGSNHL